MEYEIIKPHAEQVLTKQATHFGVKSINQNEGIVVGDLLMEQTDDSEVWHQVLAIDRYYPISEMLTSEEVAAIEAGL